MKHRQTAQPRATPAPAILGGDRVEAATGRGAVARGPPRAAGPQACFTRCCWRRPENFLPGRCPRGPCAGGAAGRRTGHCTAPAREACPGFPPRGHPQRQASGPAPHVLAQVAVGVPAGPRPLHDQQACVHEGRHLPYVFVQGSPRPVVGVAHLCDR